MSDTGSSDAKQSAHCDEPFWRVVRHALKGEHHDYTSIALNRAVLLLAVPMVLEMLMQSLFAIVDIFWVSRLGKEAVAVVGLTEAIMTLIYAVAVGISFAATALVARRIGERNPERAARAAAQIVLLGVTMSAGLGVVLAFSAADVLRLMGADESIVAMGTNFARIMFGCNVTVFLSFLISAIFRGAGDAVLAMRTLWLANALNIVLGPCFIFGLGPVPELGVTGAAVATNIGRGIGVLYQLWHLAGHHSRIRVRLHHFKPAFDMLKSIVTTAASGTVQVLISTTSVIGLFKIVSMYGSAALAGYTIAIRVMAFAVLPAGGLARAGATLVGQNLGAGRPDRSEAAVRIAMRFNVIFLGVVGALFVIFAHPLIAMFTTDPDVLKYGARALRILSMAFPFYAAGMCLGAAFNGAGDTWTPTRINFFCFWLGQIPLAWVLAEVVSLGPIGIFVAMPICSSVLTLWTAVVFNQGRWKLQKV